MMAEFRKSQNSLWNRVLTHYSYFSVVVTFLFVSVVDTEAVVVDSPVGKIRGLQRTHPESGASYLTFKAIPYAQPPVGNLRFAKPQPPDPFGDIFDASDVSKNVICPHPSMMTFGETSFSEDCLVLSIQLKDIDLEAPLKKVVVFVHGGGFIVGSSNIFDAKSFVINQNVIVVVFNYRLGVMGFLSTEDEASPGNYAFWDQLMAVKWVKRNIRAFGGDPDDITLAGESAGSASVGYLSISPHSKGVFTKVYQHSGGATSPFARSIGAQTHTLKLATMLGCWNKATDQKISVEESSEVVQCLRRLPMSAISSFNAFPPNDIMFGPVIDNDFVRSVPISLVQNETYLDSVGFFDRSYIYAFNNNEFDLFAKQFEFSKDFIFMSNTTSTAQKEAAWTMFQAKADQFYKKSRLGETWASDSGVKEAIDDFYATRFPDTFNNLVDKVTDLNFYIAALDHARAASLRRSCHSYVLKFDYFPEFMKGEYRGFPHGADLMFWFDMKMQDIDALISQGLQDIWTDRDEDLKEVYSSVIGSFIRTGNPNNGEILKELLLQPGVWPEYDLREGQYLRFNLRPWVDSWVEKDKQDLWYTTLPTLMGQKPWTPADDDEEGDAKCGGNPASHLSQPVSILVWLATFYWLGANH